jgi:peroxiredoxin
MKPIAPGLQSRISIPLIRRKGAPMLGRRRPGLALILILAWLVAVWSLADERKPVETNDLKLGMPAPDFTLPDSTEEKLGLAGFRGQKHIALVFFPALFEEGDSVTGLRSLEKAVPELAVLDTVLLAVSVRPVEVNRVLRAREGLSFHLLSDPDRTVVKKYLVWNQKEGSTERVAFLIDKDGILRRIERNLKPVTQGQALIEVVRNWQRGKRVYNGYCARCHGESGNESSYPNIKPLGGIGNRLTEPQILEATAATGVVNLQAIPRDELEALAIYVAGL